MEEQKSMGIYRALAAVMKESGFIAKEQVSKGVAIYKYRGIDDVYNAIHPLLGKHGVFVLPTVLERKCTERRTAKGGFVQYITLRVRYEFAHEDGSFVMCEVIGEAMDSGDKGTNKAMAIAHKYAILQMFCIPTEDMQDPDATSIELAPKNNPFTEDESSEKQAKGGKRKASDRQVADFRAFLNDHFNGNQRRIYQSIGDFFEREVKSADELTLEEMESFMDACTSL